MFRKKKSPVPPYTLQVLTTEYLIEGTVEGDMGLSFPEDEKENTPLQLNSVKIQTTKPVDIPAMFCEQFIIMGDNLVALIPRIEIDQLQQYEAWQENDVPVEGVFYAAQYKMTGKLMFLSEDLHEREMPIVDVHITSLTPGTHWGEIYAPFALLNTHWLHGYEPTQEIDT